MNKTNISFSLIIISLSIVSLLSCSKKDKKSEKSKPVAVVKSKKPKKPVEITKGFYWIGSDYHLHPVLLGPEIKDLQNANYIAHYTPNGKIKLIESRDSEAQIFKKWLFIYNSKGILKEIRHQPYPFSKKSSVTFFKRNNEDCVSLFTMQGMETSRKCWKKEGKFIIQTDYDLFWQKVSLKKLVVTKKNMIKIVYNYTLHGEQTSTEQFDLKIGSDSLSNSYKKTEPLGYISSWIFTKRDKRDHKTEMIYYYPDHSVRASTIYKFKNRYNAEGEAVTEDGMTLKLKLKLDKYGHRLSEKKYLGSHLFEEEKSFYNTSGNLVKRVVKDGKGETKNIEVIKYNSYGLVSYRERYRGNIHNLICTDKKSKGRVMTKLPSLEKAIPVYDSLGRVITLKRYYLDQLIDEENISYLRGDLASERSIVYGNSPKVHKTTYEFNKKGQIVTERLFTDNKITEMVKYIYNPGGLLAKKEYLKGDGTAPTKKEYPDGTLVFYTYSKKGSLIEERWTYSDGKPAMTKKSEGCSSCKLSKDKSVSIIKWTYNAKNLLTTIKEYGLKNSLLYTANYKYTKNGLVASKEQNWLKEKKKQIMESIYSPAGWTKSTKLQIFMNNKEVYREVRTFDKTLLTGIEKYKKGKLVNKVKRTFKDGKMIERQTVDAAGKTIIVKMKRNQFGAVTDEKATDERGKPVLTHDMWKNNYSRSLAFYTPRGYLEKLVYFDDIHKTKLQSVFRYDDNGNLVERKVLKNGKLKLQTLEFFTDPLLKKYGIFTSQVRTAINDKKREVYSYKVKVNSKKLTDSNATITVGSKKPIKLTHCTCRDCGVTISYPDFMQ